MERRVAAVGCEYARTWEIGAAAVPLPGLENFSERPCGPDGNNRSGGPDGHSCRGRRESNSDYFRRRLGQNDRNRNFCVRACCDSPLLRDLEKSFAVGARMKRILVATSNPGNLRDFAGAAARYGIEVQAVPTFSSHL